MCDSALTGILQLPKGATLYKLDRKTVRSGQP